MTLAVVPIPFATAKAFVALHHRHHQPPAGHKFSLGAYLDGRLVGVAIVGRPSSRVLDQRGYLEVTRTCTDGTRNANSCLYGAARREAKRRGYAHLITYTMGSESGASLRGAGWRIDNTRRARQGWNSPSRPRQSHGVDGIDRIRWIA